MARREEGGRGRGTRAGGAKPGTRRAGRTRSGRSGRGAGAGGANHRFKQGAGARLWGALAVAVAVHFALFWLAPGWRVEAEMVAPRPVEAVTLLAGAPPAAEVELPPPPEELVRPAAPVLPEAPLVEDVTMPAVSFEDVGPFEIPPPPVAEEPDELAGYEFIAPSMIAPELKNREEIRDELYRRYPRDLQNAGIGGRLLVQLWIDETGAVRDWRITQRSGRPELDEAAEEVIPLMEFSPAVNRDRLVRVIVTLPIVFVTH